MKEQLSFRKEDAKKFNQLAREQMKLKLLADISIDLQICEIEGWDKKEYLIDLSKLFNEIIEKTLI